MSSRWPAALGVVAADERSSSRSTSGPKVSIPPSAVGPGVIPAWNPAASNALINAASREKT
jgi:hypothetical protein